MIVKLCKDCRHRVPETREVAVVRCSKVVLFPGTSPVTGEPYLESCGVARGTGMDWNGQPMCGPEGRWFEPKET